MADTHAKEIGALEEASRRSIDDRKKLFDRNDELNDKIHDIELNTNDIPRIVGATERMAVSIDKIQEGIDRLQNTVDGIEDRVQKIEDKEDKAVDYVIVLTWLGSVLKSRWFYFLILAVAALNGSDKGIELFERFFFGP